MTWTVTFKDIATGAISEWTGEADTILEALDMAVISVHKPIAMAVALLYPKIDISWLPEDANNPLCGVGRVLYKEGTFRHYSAPIAVSFR